MPFSYHQIDPIKQSLIDAGFGDINIAVLRLEKEIPDAALFAQGIVHGNPLIDQIRARGGVDPDRVVDAVAHALRAEFGTDPSRMTLQAMIFSVSKGDGAIAAGRAQAEAPMVVYNTSSHSTGALTATSSKSPFS